MKKLLTLIAFLGAMSAATASAQLFGNDNSTNQNNTQTNLQLQGQQQGQISVNENRNSNTNLNSNNADAVSLSGAAAVVEQGVNNDIVIQAQKIPVSTAFAAALTASQGTCMGSSSLGGQGASLGLSFGSTWNDKNCNNRLNAAMMMTLDQPKIAMALMCQNEGVAEAAELAGLTCPSVAQAESDDCAYPTESCKRSKKIN